MQLSTSIILLTTIVTGTFYTVAVRATPYISSVSPSSNSFGETNAYFPNLRKQIEFTKRVGPVLGKSKELWSRFRLSDLFQDPEAWNKMFTKVYKAMQTTEEKDIANGPNQAETLEYKGMWWFIYQNPWLVETMKDKWTVYE
ncbi:hypothetical protein BC835DRAFT_1331562 [Cytidiella melzeri]|nr:hypothetical protein BC835DRAFT_1331562 [Cytidiella melzeri]